MRDPLRRQPIAVIALALFGCGGAAEGDGDAQAESAVATSTPAPAGRSGTFDLGGTIHPFRIVTCDLTGTRPDGLLLRGTGTAPDGRPLSVVVERTAARSRSQVWESATLYFGSIVDGDHWTARRGVQADGRWMSGRPGAPADGPLIEVSGNELLVQANVYHETDDTSRPGTLRATCG